MFFAISTTFIALVSNYDNEHYAENQQKCSLYYFLNFMTHWKYTAIYDHQNALLITETYGCPDPYALTEMEDVALTVVMDRLACWIA